MLVDHGVGLRPVMGQMVVELRVVRRAHFGRAAGPQRSRGVDLLLGGLPSSSGDTSNPGGDEVAMPLDNPLEQLRVGESLSGRAGVDQCDIGIIAGRRGTSAAGEG